MHLKRKSQNTSQIKYWLIKVVNVIIKSFKDFFKINNTEMYSTYNKGKSAVAEKFIRTIKKKKNLNI